MEQDNKCDPKRAALELAVDCVARTLRGVLASRNRSDSCATEAVNPALRVAAHATSFLDVCAWSRRELDFSDFHALDNLALTGWNLGPVRLPPNLRRLSLRAHCSIELPRNLRVVTIERASEHVLAQLVNLQALTKLKLYCDCDAEALARLGLAPNLRELTIEQDLPMGVCLPFPATLRRLRVRAHGKLPNNLPAAITRLAVEINEPCVDVLEVPEGVQVFKLSLCEAYRMVTVKLPRGLQRMTLSRAGNVRRFESLPESLRFLCTYAKHHLPPGPHNIEHLDLHVTRSARPDPNLATKCPLLRVVRFTFAEQFGVFEFKQLFKALPFECLEELCILGWPGPEFDLDFGPAKNLRRLDLAMSPKIYAVNLNACTKLTHLSADAGCLKIESLPNSLEHLRIEQVGPKDCLGLKALAQLPNLRSLHVSFCTFHSENHQSTKWWDISSLCSRLDDFRVFSWCKRAISFENKVYEFLVVPRRAKSWLGITFN